MWKLIKYLISIQHFQISLALVFLNFYNVLFGLWGWVFICVLNLWDSKHLFKTIISLIGIKQFLQFLVLYVVQFLIFHFSSIFYSRSFLKNIFIAYTYILNVIYILRILYYTLTYFIYNYFFLFITSETFLYLVAKSSHVMFTRSFNQNRAREQGKLL